MTDINAFDNENHGLKVVGSSKMDVLDSSFKNAGSSGVYIDDSDNIYFKAGSRFEYNDLAGVTVRGYSSSYFGDGYETGEAVVKNNGVYGLNVYQNSLMRTGYQHYFGGNNTIKDNGTYNARAATGSQIIAQKTWWGSANESTILSKLSWDGTSTIDYSNWLTSHGPYKNVVPAVAATESTYANDEVTPIGLVQRYSEIASQNREHAVAMLRSHENTGDSEVAHTARLLLMRALLHGGSVAEAAALGSDLLNNVALGSDERALVAKRLFYTHLIELQDAGTALEMLEELRLLQDEDYESGLLATVYQDVTGTVPETKVAGRSAETANKLTIYPNPFNPAAAIGFRLAQDGPVRLAVYDLLGREISVLVDDVRSAGDHVVSFDATGLAGGVYLTRLASEDGDVTQTMLLIK